MDYEKEIPFEAFDSELMRQEIFIPKGFTATIEGDKIILTRIESEDERIRKFLIKWIQDNYYNGTTEIPTKTLIAWLEKHETSYTKKDVDDAFVEGMAFAKNELEKQGEKKSSDEVLKIRQELYQSGYNDGYKHGCEDTKKQGEQKPSDTFTNIEYTRTDAFIEKVEKAMIEWAGTYISKTTGGGVNERKILAKDVLNYFENYMKGE